MATQERIIDIPDKKPKVATSLDTMGVNNSIPPDLSALESMTKEGLISLVQRMARQCGMVACTSEDELRQAFLDRMAHIGLTAKAVEALAAMEKRMDRVEGKPMQRVDTRNLNAYVMMPTVKMNGKDAIFNVGEPLTIDNGEN